jgi:hypothetical protein
MIGQDVAVRPDDDSRSQSVLHLALRALGLAAKAVSKKAPEERIIGERELLRGPDTSG